MDRERIAHIFFFGFLAVMGYELYLLLSPFLVPLVWAMLLAFIAHPALLQLERFIRSRTAAALLITAILALVIAVPHRVAFEQTRARSHQGLAGPVRASGRIRAGRAAGRSTPTPSLRSRRGSSSRACVSKTYATGCGKASTYLTGYFTANVTTLARNLVTFVFDVVIMLFSFFYLLRDGEDYFEFVRTLTPLPDEDKSMVFETLSSICPRRCAGCC